MIPLPDPPLRDELIALRPFREDDLAMVVRACRDPLTQLYTRVPDDYGAAAARPSIPGARGRRVVGESIDLAAASAADDAALGCVGIMMDRHDARRGEIGYWVAPEARGRGVAARALRLMSRWALTAGGFARLDLQAALSNGASIRAAESCGFVREGTLRDAWYRGPGRSDMAFFSLLPRDLPGA
jgi:RimJ/RimL family protein N-acetyltransferase